MEIWFLWWGLYQFDKYKLHSAGDFEQALRDECTSKTSDGIKIVFEKFAALNMMKVKFSPKTGDQLTYYIISLKKQLNWLSKEEAM